MLKTWQLVVQFVSPLEMPWFSIVKIRIRIVEFKKKISWPCLFILNIQGNSMKVSNASHIHNVVHIVEFYWINTGTWSEAIFISLSDQTTELKTIKRKGKQPENMLNSAKMANLIIISTGSVITVVLLTLISCTYRKGCSSVNVNGNNHASQNVQEMDTVYAEISRRRTWKNNHLKLWLFWLFG